LYLLSLEIFITLSLGFEHCQIAAIQSLNKEVSHSRLYSTTPT
jgi:hypothetical protein